MSARRKGLLQSTSGAVAPTVALSLFGLIAAGGIGFDYARLAGMNSELQTSADQAALAAAGQLDGKTGACARAARAASTLLTNNTRFANDGGALAASVANEATCDATGKVRFYQDKAKTTAATSDANANFVLLTVNQRVANYILTPIVRAFSSGNIDATAYAGVAQSICKVPPVMICNPQETGSSTTFDVTQLVGKGLKLVSVGNGGGSWAPGNFGYLDSNSSANGASGLRESLGWSSPPGDCIAGTGVSTKPGASVSVTDALNTRFDIYTNVSCPTGGNCPASINSVKDLVRPANANGNNACTIHNQGWQEVSSGLYQPTSATTALPTSTTPVAMGHPRDMCHAAPSSASGYCSGAIGDGSWDRDAYFRTNYGWTSTQWQTNTGLSSSATRYQVYSWEIANRGATVGGKTIGASRVASGNGASALTDYDQPVCSSIQGYGTGTVPSATTVDRRRISVAVVNCMAHSVNGSSSNVPVEKWMDAFLVEPSFNRSAENGTNAGDIYVEPIGLTSAGSNGQTQAQVIERSVPYLIE